MYIAGYAVSSSTKNGKKAYKPPRRKCLFASGFESRHLSRNEDVKSYIESQKLRHLHEGTLTKGSFPAYTLFPI